MQVFLFRDVDVQHQRVSLAETGDHPLGHRSDAEKIAPVLGVDLHPTKGRLLPDLGRVSFDLLGVGHVEPRIDEVPEECGGTHGRSRDADGEFPVHVCAEEDLVGETPETRRDLEEVGQWGKENDDVRFGNHGFGNLCYERAAEHADVQVMGDGVVAALFAKVLRGKGQHRVPVPPRQLDGQVSGFPHGTQESAETVHVELEVDDVFRVGFNHVVCKHGLRLDGGPDLGPGRLDDELDRFGRQSQPCLFRQ